VGGVLQVKVGEGDESGLEIHDQEGRPSAGTLAPSMSAGQAALKALRVASLHACLSGGQSELLVAESHILRALTTALRS
jgi:hypothetical protein